MPEQWAKAIQDRVKGLKIWVTCPVASLTALAPLGSPGYIGRPVGGRLAQRESTTLTS